MGWRQRLKRLNPGASWTRVLWWEIVRYVLWLVLWGLYRYRAYQWCRVPAEGGVLLVCNHQSFMDLAIVGVGLRHRQYHPLARRTLFKNRFFAALIRSLNAVELDQEQRDFQAMRRAVDLLRQGRMVLIFPEGGRTPDGEVKAFHEGMMLLVRRARPVVVPAAVEGGYDIWPADRKYPRPRGRAGVIYGEPIAAQRLIEMVKEEGKSEAVECLRERVVELREELAVRMRGEGTKGRTDEGTQK